MSELRIQTWTMPAADLGPENPLPALGTTRKPFQAESAPGIPEEMLKNMAYGHIPNISPYTVQDGFTRQLHSQRFPRRSP